MFPLAATYDHCGPLTSTVGDADLIARAMAGPDPLDITTRSDPYGERTHGVDAMRIGWDETFVTEHAHPDVAATSRAAVDAPADAGAEIIDVTVPLRVEAAVPFGNVFRAEVAAAHHDLWPAHRDEYTPGFAAAIKAAAAVTRDDVVRAHEFRIGFRHAIDHLFTDIDALVTPTAPVNALPESPWTRTSSPGSPSPGSGTSAALPPSRSPGASTPNDSPTACKSSPPPAPTPPPSPRPPWPKPPPQTYHPHRAEPDCCA